MRNSMASDCSFPSYDLSTRLHEPRSSFVSSIRNSRLFNYNMAPNDPSLDAIVSQIQSCTDISSVSMVLLPYLNNLSESVFAARSHGQTDPIDALSPATHSFAYLYFL